MNRRSDGTFERTLTYGVGLDDVEGSKEFTIRGKRFSEQYYSVWKNMLKRCYYKNGEYLGKVVVCKEWHILSNFKTWFENNYTEGYALDKDLFGGKVYSLNTCVFIPPKLNNYLMNTRKKCGSYYDVGRNLHQSYTNSLNGKRVNIGRFKTEEEAVFYAKTTKMVEISKLLNDEGLSTKVKIGLSQLLDDMFFQFITPYLNSKSFVDVSKLPKLEGEPYDLSIINLNKFIK